MHEYERRPVQYLPHKYFCYSHGGQVPISHVNGVNFCEVCVEETFTRLGIHKILPSVAPALSNEDPYAGKLPSSFGAAEDGDYIEKSFKGFKKESDWIDATEIFPPKDHPVMMRRIGSEQVPKWQWKELPNENDTSRGKS